MKPEFNDIHKLPDSVMKFMFSQSLVQVPVKYVSVQCRGELIAVLYGNLINWDIT